MATMKVVPEELSPLDLNKDSRVSVTEPWISTAMLWVYLFTL